MSPSNRRVFMLQIAAGSSALMLANAHAQAAPMVNEKDAQPMALGYAADSTKVDAKKFPKHTPAQQCSNCALYTGEAGGVAGSCGIFPGKHVAARGWCSAYAKKA